MPRLFAFLVIRRSLPAWLAEGSLTRRDPALGQMIRFESFRSRRLSRALCDILHMHMLSTTLHFCTLILLDWQCANGFLLRDLPQRAQSILCKQ
jgi:hypothetical protein